MKRTNVPTVSVLMTVFNRVSFLSDAIMSLLSSSFEDFELIVVDDCSTDGSYAVACDIAKTHSRISVSRNEKNLGDYGNRMRAASLAHGKYLKYLDSDDLIYPHGLAVMVQNMESNPDVAFALSHSLPEEKSPYPVKFSPLESYRKHFLERGCFGCGPSGAIIRRDAFETLGGFRPEWGVLSDLEFWLRAGARFSMLLQQPALVWWRTHEGQEFRSGDAAERYLIQGYQLGMNALASPDCPLGSDELSVAGKRLRQKHARRLLSLALRQRQFRMAERAFRASNLRLLDLLSALLQRRGC